MMVFIRKLFTQRRVKAEDERRLSDAVKCTNNAIDLMETQRHRLDELIAEIKENEQSAN